MNNARGDVAVADKLDFESRLRALVQYLNLVEQGHRENRKESRNGNERASAIPDDILFKHPESSHLGDCPICFLPMPLDPKLFTFQACCGQLLCDGCSHAHSMCEIERGGERKCPFCRDLAPTTGEEYKQRLLRRVEVNDPTALKNIGHMSYEEEDYENAFQYWTRAAEAGNEPVHFDLGMLYMSGKFVGKDKNKCISHLERAAIRGHVDARYALGYLEWESGRFDRGVKHWIISASFGNDESIQQLKECYKLGHVSKDDFAKALRAHHAAVDAMKSPQREKAELIYKVIERGMK